MADLVTERVTYTGRVQGVGFRFTTRSIARRYPVTGYVRNMPDGSVELVAQGAQAAINALLADVAEHFGANIRHCDRRPDESAETYTVFEIRA